jgi:hypothetical protein
VLVHLLAFLDARSLAAVCGAAQIGATNAQQHEHPPPPPSARHFLYTPLLHNAPVTGRQSSSAAVAIAANADELWNAAFDRDLPAYLRVAWPRETRNIKRHYLDQVGIRHRQYARHTHFTSFYCMFHVRTFRSIVYIFTPLQHCFHIATPSHQRDRGRERGCPGMAQTGMPRNF